MYVCESYVFMCVCVGVRIRLCLSIYVMYVCCMHVCMYASTENRYKIDTCYSIDAMHVVNMHKKKSVHGYAHIHT